MSQTSQETSTLFQRGKQVTLLVHDWWISIHFACFCFWMTVTIMIDGSIKSNYKFDFKLQSSHVIEKCYKLVMIIIWLSEYKDVHFWHCDFYKHMHTI